MFYKLKAGLALRGWQKLPYALCDLNKGTTVFIGKREFEALSLCDGVTPAGTLFTPSDLLAIIKKAEENGVIEECHSGETLDPIQEYRFYDSRYIRMAHWSMTGKCNYRCRHCFMSAPDAKYGELKSDQCVDIINQLADCGIMQISLTGGECLVRDDFMELVDLMRKKNIHIKVIYSNGALVSEALLDALKERGLEPEFNMSYDGVGWHDWLRGIDGAEAAVERAFKLCREKGFPTAAELCIHQGNKHLLRESVNRLAEWGCGHLKTNPVSGTELWDKHGDGKSITMEELYDVYLDYIPRFFDDGSPLSLQLGGFFMAQKGGKKYMIPSIKYNGTDKMNRQCICGHARHVMYIAADGKILPCMSLSSMPIQERFPNILDGLAKGLSDSYYMSFIDTRLEDYLSHNPECAACEHKYICGGGCRASALEHSTDIYAKDLACCGIFTGGYGEKIKAAVESVIGTE